MSLAHLACLAEAPTRTHRRRASTWEIWLVWEDWRLEVMAKAVEWEGEEGKRCLDHVEA